MDRFSLSRGLVSSKLIADRDKITRTDALRMKKGKVVTLSANQEILHLPDLTHILGLRRLRNKHIRKNPSMRTDLDQKKKFMRSTYTFSQGMEHLNMNLNETVDMGKRFYLQVLIDELTTDEGLRRIPLPSLDELAKLPMTLVIGADICYLQEYYLAYFAAFFVWQFQGFVPLDPMLEKLMIKSKTEQGTFFEINAFEIIQVLEEWPNPPPFWEALLSWDSLTDHFKIEIEKYSVNYVME